MHLNHVMHLVSQVATIVTSAVLLFLPGARASGWVGVWIVAVLGLGVLSLLRLREQGLLRATPREIFAKAQQRKFATSAIETLAVALSLITAFVLAIR